MGLKRTKMGRVGQTQEVVAGGFLIALVFRRCEGDTQHTSTLQHFNGSTQHINSLQDRSPRLAHLVSNFGPNTAALDAKLGGMCWAFGLALVAELPQAVQPQR
jgi:hypothetical protein